MNKSQTILLLLICGLTAIFFVSSCRSRPQPTPQETTLSFKYDKEIWIPIQYRDSSYLAFFDTGAPNMFPSYLIRPEDYVDTTKSNSLRSFMSNEVLTTHRIPSLPLRIGSAYTKEPFISVPDSAINIGRGMIMAYNMHFNFRNSTMKFSNIPIPLDHPHKKDSVRFRLVWHKSGIPLIDVVAKNQQKKKNNTFWIFDTGNLASHVTPQGDTVRLDMVIAVRDFDKFYASNSIFASVREYAQHIPNHHSTRYDHYLIDTITINEKKYPNFRVVIMKNESIVRKGHLCLLGMGFVDRFTNLYIDKKQVILYNEE